MYKKKIKGGSISGFFNSVMHFILNIFNSVTIGFIVILYLLCLHLPLALWSEHLLYTYFYKCSDDLGFIHGKIDLYDKLTNQKSTIIWKGLVKVFLVIFNLSKTLMVFILFIILFFITLILPYLFLIYYFIIVYSRGTCRNYYDNSNKPFQKSFDSPMGQLIDFQNTSNTENKSTLDDNLVENQNDNTHTDSSENFAADEANKKNNPT